MGEDLFYLIFVYFIFPQHRQNRPGCLGSLGFLHCRVLMTDLDVYMFIDPQPSSQCERDFEKLFLETEKSLVASLLPKQQNQASSLHFGFPRVICKQKKKSTTFANGKHFLCGNRIFISS